MTPVFPVTSDQLPVVVSAADAAAPLVSGGADLHLVSQSSPNLCHQPSLTSASVSESLFYTSP